MRNRIPKLLVMMLVALLFVSVKILVAEEKKEKAQEAAEPPEEIVIENKGYRQDRKPPVKFSHQNHAELYNVTCDSCHHFYDEGKNAWKQGDPVNKCIECHDPVKSDDKIMKLNLAYHANCIGCHKKVVKEGISKDAPYKFCYQCHKKTSG